MDKIKYLLQELDKGGMGEYQNINFILQEIYPFPSSFGSDDDYVRYTQRIESFLGEMKHADLINFRKEGFFGVKMNGHYHLFNHARFMATITYNGVEKLKALTETPISLQTIYIHGNRNQINHSHGDNNQLVNEHKQITKKKRPRWDIIGIIAIGVSILLWLLDKFFFSK